MSKHMTPDGVIHNFLEECDRNEPDYEFDAKVKLMWAQTDYYKAMTELVSEQIITEKLRQQELRKDLGLKENHSPRSDKYIDDVKKEICKKITEKYNI